ncbi:MAG: glycosyltransferase family 2 protein [Gemmataceae bacterium]|nr:glycosyltransferase family 2 protein [Gemmataceae bacterium]
MTPSLSVVIPSHRRVDLLADCLTALDRYAPANTEIIVVDDGSNQSAVSRAATQFPRSHVIRHDRARGFCSAANAGIARARAPIVQLLNDDAQVTAGWSDEPLAAFADQTVAAVAPLILRATDGRIDSAGDDYDAGGFASPRARGQLPAGDWLRPAEVAGASGCAAFYRRSAVLAAGGFPESFVAYFEDVDLSQRLRSLGHRIVYAPTSRVIHRGGATHGRPRGRLLQQQSCNEERVFWRNTTGSPAVLARHAAVLGGKALRRLGEGTLTPWLLGRVRAWIMEASWHRSSAS